MIHLPASVRVHLCLAPCDMRKSFDSLQTLVREHLELDAFAGHLFVFASRRKDRVKILYWDRDGFAIWSKRLEEGTYAVPFGEAGAAGIYPVGLCGKFTTMRRVRSFRLRFSSSKSSRQRAPSARSMIRVTSHPMLAATS
jgi:transposase